MKNTSASKHALIKQHSHILQAANSQSKQFTSFIYKIYAVNT